MGVEADLPNARTADSIWRLPNSGLHTMQTDKKQAATREALAPIKRKREHDDVDRADTLETLAPTTSKRKREHDDVDRDDDSGSPRRKVRSLDRRTSNMSKQEYLYHMEIVLFWYVLPSWSGRLFHLLERTCTTFKAIVSEYRLDELLPLREGANTRILAKSETGDLESVYDALLDGQGPLQFEMLQDLILSGMDPNRRGSDMHTLLMRVCMCTQLFQPGSHDIGTVPIEDYVEFLVNADADIEAEDADRNTALIHALSYPYSKCKIRIVTYLTTLGANVNAYNRLCRTPLTLASYMDTNDMTKELLANNADPNQSFTRTALHYAVEQRNCERARALLEGGANPNQPMGSNTPLDSPLYICCRMQQYDKSGSSTFEMLETLLEYGADPTVTCEGLCTPLHRLLTSPNQLHIPSIELLLQHPTKSEQLQKRNKLGNTALFAVCDRVHVKDSKKNGHVCEAVELLLSHGADVEATTRTGRTPLMTVCQGKSDHDTTERLPERLSELLLQYGANVNSTDRYGNTPLHYACKAGSEDLVRLLLDRGADLNSTDHTGCTPLHHACKRHILLPYTYNVVRLILDRGADLNSTDHSRRTPLWHACKTGSEDLIQLLLELGADSQDILDWASSIGELA